MKKKERDVIINTLKRTNSKNLRSELATLEDWEHNNAMKVNSWFWTPGGNCGERARKERYYSRNDELQIGKVTLRYRSNCEMSRAHVYWNNTLWIKNSNVNINFGDVRKLMAEIKAILARRELAAAKVKAKATA